LQTGNNGVENTEPKTGDSGLKTFERGVESRTESSSLGHVNGTLQALDGRVKYWETKAGDSGLKTFKGRVEECAEGPSLGDIDGPL
jgi:hypothetical protein